MHNGRVLGFAVFHGILFWLYSSSGNYSVFVCLVSGFSPSDEFVANCKITFDQLKPAVVNDIWADLEPHGRLHLVIELQGTAEEGDSFFCDNRHLCKPPNPVQIPMWEKSNGYSKNARERSWAKDVGQCVGKFTKWRATNFWRSSSHNPRFVPTVKSSFGDSSANRVISAKVSFF